MRTTGIASVRESFLKLLEHLQPRRLWEVSNAAESVWGMIETSIGESAAAEKMVQSRFAEQRFSGGLPPI